MSEHCMCCGKHLGSDPADRHEVSSALFVSKCCGKPLHVGGEGTGDGATNWYECTGCGKSCDVIRAPIGGTK